MSGLQSWVGWAELQVRVERAGFHLPQRYQAWMEAFCDAECGRADLRKYWAEVAAESVLNEATSNPNVRMGPISYPHYRSEYLDRLSTELFPTGVGSITHPCVMAFHEKNTASNFELLLGMRSDFELMKVQEARDFDLAPPAEGEVKFKKQLVPIVEQVSGQLGFARLRGSSWSLRFPGLLFGRTDRSGRTFLINLDTGGNREILGSLPLRFLIHMEGEGRRPVPLGDLSVIVPGCEHYARRGGALTTIYGVFALVGIFDIFSRSFADPVTPG